MKATEVGMAKSATEGIRPAGRTRGITYAVRDIVALAHEVARTGKEMLYLNIGDPNQFDFETPPHLIDAVHKAMRDNHCCYSPSSGIPAAIKAVEGEAARNGIRNIRDLFITTGGSEASRSASPPSSTAARMCSSPIRAIRSTRRCWPSSRPWPSPTS